MKMAWKVTHISSSALLVGAFVVVSPVTAQLVSTSQPSVIAPAGNDERINTAVKFARLYNAGKVGDALREHAEMDVMFGAMFGDDWTDTPYESRSEMTNLYVRLMNLAFERPADAKPPPEPRSSDVLIDNATKDAASVRVIVHQDGRPVRMYLDMVRRGRMWKIADLHESGEASWVNEIQRRWVVVKGNTTPQEFIRNMYVGIVEASRPPASQPG
jgi:hypothetical protein